MSGEVLDGIQRRNKVEGGIILLIKSLYEIAKITALVNNDNDEWFTSIDCVRCICT